MGKKKRMNNELGEKVINHLRRCMVTYSVPEVWRDDLEGEILLSLCAMDDDKLIDLENRGKLEQYIGGMIKKSYRSSTSTFYAKYRRMYKTVATYDNEQQYNDIPDTADIYGR